MMSGVTWAQNDAPIRSVTVSNRHNQARNDAIRSRRPGRDLHAATKTSPVATTLPLPRSGLVQRVLEPSRCAAGAAYSRQVGSQRLPEGPVERRDLVASLRVWSCGLTP
jgi:hypothetical protein